MQTALTLDASASGWDRSLYAFLAEKQQRSGSMRTVNAYAGMLRDFFRRAAKTPDAVGPQDAFAWAYGTGLSPRPLADTIRDTLAWTRTVEQPSDAGLSPDAEPELLAKV